MRRRQFLQCLTALPALGSGSCHRRNSRPADDGPEPPLHRGPGRILNAHQWETLEAISARLIPTDADPGARETNVANFIDAQLVSGHLTGYRQLILSGPAEADRLAKRFGSARFVDLPPAKQDEVLHALERGTPRGDASSSSRELFVRLLLLSLEGFLADPIYGGNQKAAGWKLMGFAPRPPLPRAPYRTRPREPRYGAPIGRDVAHRGAVDAIVVGSGAGGAPVALGLSRAGYRVVVLEKGPAYDQRDFINDELGQCRRDFFLPYTWRDPHVTLDRSGRPVRTREGWTSCCVGGATVHMTGYAFRLHPEDLKLRSLLGQIPGSDLADWPIAWEELLPYYDKIETALGVSGVAGKNSFERFRRPLPLPPLPENGIARLVDQSCTSLGLHPFPTARAVISRAWQGRGRCQLSFFCGDYGCQYGAKSSALAALLPPAVATGNCEVRPLSMVHSVELDARGRASGVRYFDAAGREHRLAATVVVLACSPVETARLLLLSSPHGRGGGLGNGSGLLGRNLMFGGAGGGLVELDRADPRLRDIDWRQPFVHRSFQDLYFVEGGDAPRLKGGTVNFVLPRASPIARAERLAAEDGLVWGSALKDLLRRQREVRELGFQIYSETLPTLESQVTLDPEIKDAWGIPAARFVLQPHPYDRLVRRVLLEKGLEVLRTLAGKNPRPGSSEGKNRWLMGGTCRFGDDPDSSVLDRDCRSHEVRNLFVTDGSFLPNHGGVPNTLTVEANALRVADRIVALGRAHSFS